MFFRNICFALAALPMVARADTNVFDGNYSVTVGPGPVTDLYILSVRGSKGDLTLAKAFQRPSPPDPVKIEQDSHKMTVALASNELQKLIFEKSSKGLTCISGCANYLTSWESVKTAKEIEAANVNPADRINFDALPVVDIGNIDGAWVTSRSGPDDSTDIAYEIKGEFIKRYYYMFGLYPKSSTPDVLMLASEFFIYPKTGVKALEIKKISDTKLIARSSQWKGQVFLYRAASINFVDLKKALVAADARTSP